MSDIIGLQNHAYTELQQSPQTVKKTKGKQLLKIIILVMLLFLAGDSVYYLFILPFNSTAKIQFSGIDTVLEADLKKAAGITGTEKWIKMCYCIGLQVIRSLRKYTYLKNIRTRF